MKTDLFLLAVSILSISACSHAPATADSSTPANSAVEAVDHRHPAAAQQRLATLPDQSAWTSLYEYADNLDLAAPGVTLSLSTGGTSVYGVINLNGKPIGAIIPENSSSSVTGETFAFTLSRAFGVTELYQPGVYHFLSEKNLEIFMAIVPQSPIYKNGKLLQNKEDNRNLILKRYATQPGGMDAVFKRWDARAANYDVIDGVGRNINPKLILPGSSAPLATLIDCSGPKPSAATVVTFNGGTNNELDAARELSTILVIDALTQQWDRFSGGNLQTLTKNGRTTFASIDNGGTWGGTRATDLNLSMVSRFDSGVAQQVLAMDDFFVKGAPYLGLQTESEFASAFDIVQAPKALAKFKTSLAMVANHIRKHPGCTF